MDEVAQLIDDARKDAKMKWSDLARRADMDPQTLRRYRNGERRTADSTRAIELAFGWPRGHIDAVASGAEPPPDVPEPPEHDDYEELRRMVEMLQAQTQELIDRIDATKQRTTDK